MNAGILTIGDEILIGQTIDTNSTLIAQELNKIGVEIKLMLSVGDNKPDIIDGLNHLSSNCDVILITGGLGPTKDDITKYALKTFFDDELEFKPDYFKRIKKKFEERDIKVTQAHREQFYLPSKAILLENDLGSAPGMLFHKNSKTYFSMPGVPYEMKHLLVDKFIPQLKIDSRSEVYHRTILTVGIGETALAERISNLTKDLPELCSIAFLPNLGSVKLRFSISGNGIDKEKKIMDRQIDKIKKEISDVYYGEGEYTLSQHIGDLLKANGLTLAVAESCTGGLLGHEIVKIPGSSAYFEGGLLTYSNQQKMSQLGVLKTTLDAHGAVSKETVIEMQKGVLKATKASVSISISGIAGPSGGTQNKPVGTIWIACGNQTDYKTVKVLAGKDRIKNMEYGVVQALNLLRRFINERIKNHN